MTESNVLTPQQTEAALLVAQNRLSNAGIAKKVGIGLRTLSDWKSLKQFRKEVDSHRLAWQQDAKTRGIADMHERLRVAKDLQRRLLSVIAQRADEMADVKGGGDTGLLTVEYKTQTSTDYSGEKPARITELVPEYKVDNATIRQILELQQYVAMELGQWKTKHVIEETKLEYSEKVVRLAEVVTPEVLAEMILRARANEQNGRLAERSHLLTDGRSEGTVHPDGPPIDATPVEPE